MKSNQARPGFELVSSCPHPATITITPRAPPIAFCFIDCVASLEKYVVKFSFLSCFRKYYVEVYSFSTDNIFFILFQILFSEVRSWPLIILFGRFTGDFIAVSEQILQMFFPLQNLVLGWYFCIRGAFFTSLHSLHLQSDIRMLCLSIPEFLILLI